MRARGGWWRRGAIAAGLSAALIAAGCGSNESTQDNIKPLKATVTLDAEPGTNPVVILRESPTDLPGDALIIFDVVLKSFAPRDYSAFDLELTFDPGRIQFATVGNDANGIVTSLGHCPSSGGQGSGTCDPFCAINGVQANREGDLLIGVATNESACGTHAMSGTEEVLMTIGFNAATPISSSIEGRVAFVYRPGMTGDCEILKGGLNPIDQLIPFDDRNATIQASR